MSSVPRLLVLPLLCSLFPGLLLAAANPAGQIFLTPKTISNLKVSTFATGDFNGDGLADLAVGTNAGLNIFLGKKGGGFTQGAQYSFTGGPASIAVGDVNGDGKLDLVTVRGVAGASVWMGNGDGTFQTAVSYNTLNGPLRVAVGDFNGDGKPDVIVAADSGGGGNGGLSLLLNRGDGTFGRAINFGNALSPFSLAAGDFNHDGKLDLVVGNEFGVNLLLGNGDGTFQNPTFYEVGANVDCDSIAAVDLNGDGHLDLAVTCAFGQNADGFGTVSIFLGNGDGTFRTPVSYTDLAEPTALAAVDFNHDGKLDLVTAGANGIGILIGHGDGTFAATDYYFGYAPMAVGDFNGDGNMDLVAGNSYGGGMSLYLNNGDGTLQANRTYLAAVYVLSPGGLATGDFNGDGKLDIATAAGLTLQVLLGNGDGTFRAPVSTSLSGYLATAIATGDFNHDGKLDVAEVDLDGGLYILLGNGDGTFQKPAYNLAIGSDFVAVGNLNHDGKLDLVSAGGGGFSRWLGNGDGTFGAYEFFGADSPFWLALADFNHDGNTDVVTSSSDVLLGNGDGTFQPATGRGFSGQGVVTGDFNGDGKADFLIPASQFVGFFVDVFLGNGDGTFKPPLSSPAMVAGGPAVAADFNHDGKLDVAMATAYNGGTGVYAMNLLLGKGDGTFQPPGDYLPGFVGSAIALGDFNQDGAPDLVLTDQLGVTVLLNVRGTAASTASSQNPSKAGQSVTFTATVQPTVAGSAQVAGAVTGSVSFFDGATLLGTSALAQGHANFTTSSLGAGAHTITAKYSGSSSYNAATSPAFMQLVNP